VAPYSSDPRTFTANLSAIELNTDDLNIENCTFYGFDKTTIFKSHSYLITFISCIFRYSNYGVHFDATGQYDLGENIRFLNCVICNNNYGIYNYLGGLRFLGCSIDYNVYEHVKDNITKIDGVSSGAMYFDNCHIENLTTTNNSTYRIRNSGTMYLDNCIFWDDYADYFYNTDELYISNPHFRMLINDYICDGVAPIVEGASFITSSFCQMIHPDLSNVKNGDFETGDLTGWTVADGTGVVVTTKKNAGSYSLELTSEQYRSAYATSKKHLVPKGCSQYFFQFYANSHQNTDTSYQEIKFYDMDGASVGTMIVSVPKNTTDSFICLLNF
jgi:hypothetical protein